MTIHTKKKTMLGYFIIYFMLIWNQTNLKAIVLEKWVIPISLVLMMLTLVCGSKRLRFWTLLCYGVLLLSVTFVRFLAGGIGLKVYFEVISMILVTALAVNVNGKQVIERYIKLVYYLAIVSLVCFVICLVVPQLFETVVPQYNTKMTYRIYSSANQYKEYPYPARGLFLYTYRYVDYNLGTGLRNSGFYTEPGVYQIVLNSALYMLMFCGDFCQRITWRQKRRYTIVLILTIITAQSTSGLLGIVLIMCGAILSSNIDLVFDRRHLLFLAAAALAFLGGEYFLNGEDSILYKVIINKLFKSGSFSLSANGSTNARLGMIMTALASMIRDPLGIGYDQFHILANLEASRFSGAVIMEFGATWGVLPMLLFLCWLFLPLKRSNLSKFEILIFIALYFNATLAQSSVSYPALVLLPLACVYTVGAELNYEDDNIRYELQFGKSKLF